MQIYIIILHILLKTKIRNLHIFKLQLILQKKIMRIVFIFLFTVFCIFFLKAQDGAVIYAGTLNVMVPNEPDVIRPGYSIGAQGKIGSPGFFMGPGLIFQKFTVDPFDKKRY